MLKEEIKQKLDSAISVFEKDCWKLFERTISVKPYCPFAAPWFLKIGWMLNFRGCYGSIIDNMVHGVQMDNMVQ